MCQHESPLYDEATASQVSPECRLYHRQGNQLPFYSRGCNIAAVCCFYSLRRRDEEETEQKEIGLHEEYGKLRRMIRKVSEPYNSNQRWELLRLNDSKRVCHW